MSSILLNKIHNINHLYSSIFRYIVNEQINEKKPGTSYSEWQPWFIDDLNLLSDMSIYLLYIVEYLFSYSIFVKNTHTRDYHVNFVSVKRNLYVTISAKGIRSFDVIFNFCLICRNDKDVCSMESIWFLGKKSSNIG
jgi:hypothetical protein